MCRDIADFENYCTTISVCRIDGYVFTNKQLLDHVRHPFLRLDAARSPDAYLLYSGLHYRQPVDR